MILNIRRLGHLADEFFIWCVCWPGHLTHDFLIWFIWPPNRWILFWLISGPRKGQQNQIGPHFHFPDFGPVNIHSGTVWQRVTFSAETGTPGSLLVTETGQSRYDDTNYMNTHQIKKNKSRKLKLCVSDVKQINTIISTTSNNFPTGLQQFRDTSIIISRQWYLGNPGGTFDVIWSLKSVVQELW